MRQHIVGPLGNINMDCLMLLLTITVVSGQENEEYGNDNKIIGGEVAEIGEFPFIVSIQHPSHHSCGGNLIATSVVLTACHCLVVAEGAKGRIKIKHPSDFNVVAGIVNLAKLRFSSYRRLKVNALKHHPKCEKPETGWNWDFGLMQLKGSFPVISEKLETIRIPTFPDTPGIIKELSDLKVSCVGAGWGVTSENGKSATLELLKVDLKLLPLKECETTLEEYAKSVGSSLRFRPDAQICTLGENGKDACKGDSGGPLLCNMANDTSGKKELIGVVSWGIGCGRPDVPGGWARLDVAYDWIVGTAEYFQRSAPSDGNGISENDVLLLFMAVINVYSYSVSCK